MNVELLTPKETAELLKVNLRTIYKWIKSGELKAVQFGDVWRLDKSYILEKFNNGNHKASDR
jgi:acetyl-CoA synthetase